MKSRHRKHLIASSPVYQVHAARVWAEFDSNAPLVLSRRETLRILEMIENPPSTPAKRRALMEEYAARRVKGADHMFELDLGK